MVPCSGTRKSINLISEKDPTVVPTSTPWQLSFSVNLPGTLPGLNSQAVSDVRHQGQHTHCTILGNMQGGVHHAGHGVQEHQQLGHGQELGISCHKDGDCVQLL